MLNKDSVDKELARRLCAAFVSYQLGGHRGDAVQKHAGRCWRFVVFPGLFNKRIGERRPACAVPGLGTPGDNANPIAAPPLQRTHRDVESTWCQR
jgi:hypothetical protein